MLVKIRNGFWIESLEIRFLLRSKDEYLLETQTGGVKKLSLDDGELLEKFLCKYILDEDE